MSKSDAQFRQNKFHLLAINNAKVESLSQMKINAKIMLLLLLIAFYYVLDIKAI